MKVIDTAPAIAETPVMINTRFRGAHVLLLCEVFFLLIIIRLAYVQIQYPEKIAAMPYFQNARSGIIPASRGRIFDAKNRPLADNRVCSILFVNPNSSRIPFEQREALALALNTNLDVDIELAREVLSRTDSTFQKLIPDMTPEQIEAFNRIETPRTDAQIALAELMKEVGIMRREIRVYPMGPIAGPILGFTASRDEGQVGLWGIENLYDDVLRGRNGRYEDLRNQRGWRIPGSREEIYPPRNGSDLILTIDSDIQALAETTIQNGVERKNASGGIIVITRPATGEILALASYPALDPSNFDEYLEDKRSLFPFATSLSYEPGSVMKIFTFAAALEEGEIQPTTEFNVGMGPMRFRGGWVPDHNYPQPIMDLRFATVNSCNRYAAMTALEMGSDRMIEWLKNFGFGQRTDVNFPSEPEGNLKESMNRIPEIDLVNMGFGHGMTASPLQLVQAMSVFANDGVMVPVRLVRGRRDPVCGSIIEMEGSQPIRVISERTHSIMEPYMVAVVDEGTARAAKTEWPVAGKTGTAQMINPAGGYYDKKFYATFIGYGPVPNPEYVIIVILEAPEWPYFGGAACGPIFRDVFNALMLREGANHPDYAMPVQTVNAVPVTSPEAASEEQTADSTPEDGEYFTLGEYVISPDPFGDNGTDDASGSSG